MILVAFTLFLACHAADLTLLTDRSARCLDGSLGGLQFCFCELTLVDTTWNNLTYSTNLSSTYKAAANVPAKSRAKKLR